MRTLEPLKYLAGSVFIYYVMAACSAPAGSSASNGGSSGGGGPGNASSSGASSSGVASGGSGTTGGGSGGGSGSGAAGSSGGNGNGGSSGSPVPDANADETQSGSRLKASYYVGADGSKQFAYFTDSARSGEQCAFATAGDGTIRCMPSGAYFIATEFADSACSSPVAETSTCTAPQYVVETTPGTSCGGYSTRVFSAGSEVSTLYAKSGTSCVSVGAPPAGYTYVTVGAEITAPSFQVATIQSE